MTRSLLLTGLRDLVRRPLHTGLMVLGVALGVAVVVAIDLAHTSASRGFARSTARVVGRATHQVLGGPGGLPQDTLVRIRTRAGVRQSAPVVEAWVTALDLDRQPLRVLGLDALSEGPFRDHMSTRSLADRGFERLFLDEKSVIVGSALADRYGLSVGDEVRVRVQDRIEALRLAGILRAADSDEAAALDGLVIMDVGNAQRLLRMTDRITRVDLIATEGEAERLAALLPPGARIASARAQAETLGQLTDAFELNLTALSLLALVVGMFLIYNTVMFSVVQRRAVIGTLRLLGATGEQVFGLVLVETVAASAVGALLGIGL
ncbi:MAG: ABC transporter permease, partial [Acidobacteria bacterium]|nr:ABC transporter permease [Acidobacteriota bacterium]